MTQVQLVLLLYGLSGGENRPVIPRICLLHLPGARVTGEGVVITLLGGSLLTDSDDERKPNKDILCSCLSY